MMNNEYECRLPMTGLVDGKDYVLTDLDYATLMRADGIFSATEAERGPWEPDNVVGGSLADQHDLGFP